MLSEDAVGTERYKETRKALSMRSSPCHALIGQAKKGGAPYDILAHIFQRGGEEERRGIPPLRPIGVNFKIIARKR